MKILVIPDTHFPYQQKTFFSDLTKILKQYKPDRIVHIGDLVDSHSISKHTPNPNSISASDEFKEAKDCIKKLVNLIGKTPVSLCLGNHDLRYFKMGAVLRMPDMYLKPFKELFDLPNTWKVGVDFVIEDIYFTHGKSSTIGKTAHAYGMSTVEGHFHSQFSINYFKHPKINMFGAFSGSALDDNSKAATYASNNLSKSIYGFLTITDGTPALIRII